MQLKSFVFLVVKKTSLKYLRFLVDYQSSLKNVMITVLKGGPVFLPYKNSLPSVKTLETLAKILHILTYSRLLLKVLIRSCLFLLYTNLLKLLIVFLVKSPIKSVKRMDSCKTNSNFVCK